MEQPVPIASPPTRLMSLDVFRGITIAGMLLVNNPGSWNSDEIYWPLEHAPWNGWTFTDLIFPFFLFIIGVAMMFSFPKRLARGESRAILFGHVVRRAAALMLLGWWGSTWWTAVFPIATAYNADGVSDFDHFLGIAMRVGFVAAALASVVLLAGTKRVWLWVPVLILGLALFFPGAFKFGRSDVIIDRLAEIRYPGVLVRIGFCYLLASAIYFVTPRPKALVAWIVALLAIYWIWMVYIPIPGFGRPDLERSFPTLETPRDELFSNWCFYIDHHVFGPHVYRKLWLEEEVVGNPEAEPIRTLIWSFDPEGLLSSMSAICSILLGILTGMWLTREDKTPGEKTTGMFSAGCWLLVIGLVMSIWFPINKRIWTSSYTVFMAGMALLFLSMCYHTIDVKGHRRWCAPFVWYGMNAITAFVLSGMMASSMGRIRIGESNTLKGWLMEQVFNPAFGAHTKDASLAFAVSFVTLWALLMGVLHWRKIYLKV